MCINDLQQLARSFATIAQTRRPKEAAVELDRFDALAKSLADDETSRRSVLGRLAASGVAAALGFTAFANGAEAKKSCLKRCKNKSTARKRRKCRKKCGKAGGCALNTDCIGGQICINARCTSTCVGNGQCTGGKICVNGACVTGCTTNAQCSGGQTCVNGGCTTICTENDDCTGEQECIEGVCGTPNTPPDDPAVDLCGASTPCPSGLLCVAGICVVGCDTNTDCGSGLVCGNLLGSTGPKVCVLPATPCGPENPCTGTILSACVLGICIEVG